MMGTRCAGCNGAFVEGDIIANCCVCLDLFHANEKAGEGSGLNCSSAVVSELRVIRLKSKNLMVYRCPECKKNGGENSRLVESIAELKTSVEKLLKVQETLDRLSNIEVPKIKNSIEELKEDHSNLDLSVKKYIKDSSADIKKLKEDYASLDVKVNTPGGGSSDRNSAVSVDILSSTQMVLNEINIRKTKENNIIVFNVPEQKKDAQNKLNSDYDLIQIQSILDKVQGVSTVLDSRKIKRLGRFDIAKTRPILVVFDNRQDVTTVLTHWRLIPKEYHVAHDLTKCQHLLYNKLKTDAKLFNDSEDNKSKKLKQIIKFVDGNPKLVTIKGGHNKRSKRGNNESAYESTDKTDSKN